MPQGSSRKIKSWVRVLVVSVGPSIVTLVFGAAATGKIFWSPVFIGTGCLVVLSSWQVTVERKAEKKIRLAKQELERAAFFDAGIQPVTEWFGKIAQGEGNYGTLREQILDRLTETAGRLMCSDALCAFYRLDRERGELILEAPSVNQGMLSRSYSRTVNNGSYMLFLATEEQGGPKFVPDIDKAHESDRIKLVNGYKTALFLPVRSGSAPQGLLVIQSRETGDIPAPQQGDILDGNYRKLYAIASLASLPRVRSQSNGQVPDRRKRDSTGQGESGSVPHIE